MLGAEEKVTGLGPWGGGVHPTLQNVVIGPCTGGGSLHLEPSTGA